MVFAIAILILVSLIIFGTTATGWTVIKFALNHMYDLD